MKETITIIALILLIFLYSCNFEEKKADEFVQEALTDTTFTAEIPQKIGGTLICIVDYSNDFHSYDYSIDYTYKDSIDHIFSLGSGRYSGQTWPKNEQLQEVGNWVILKTSSGHHSDKLIIGKVNQLKPWQEYEFSPEKVEQEVLWQHKKINSAPGNYDSKVSIEEIDSKGIVTITYEFATKNRIFSFSTAEIKVFYQIDYGTGKPVMIDIEEY
ncbi:hypothetical protein GXP67_06855 [Rhodocytophaga rosea]|uniref:Uncharacterized protein n=1 Tax=Rhodocytophaga rosea TaxID=2704465 RepID=A0A6C0GEQ9_9BACT|nr:hypothetical protein [Rhodocytophaga rosea]QHT66397.1 hypothetical protein GXP67_06855 [Rhodocytophaga rosea]